jgi:nucleotide-binding universal stress UspA family protein
MRSLAMPADRRLLQASVHRSGQAVFARILCGVDGSPAGIEGLRQSARMRAADGTILMASVATPAAAAHPETAVALEARAVLALREAERETATHYESRVLVGDAVACLLAAARDDAATLVAVGSHGTGRLGGILAGSVATAMLHRAPCSVLIARPARRPGQFPERIAVGIDGSEPSVIALCATLDLGARLGVPVVAVAAGGAATDVDAGNDVAELRRDEREPVEALLDAADSFDLLVLGARGLRGVRALGSVSERVAHRARSSVLVVRGSADRDTSELPDQNEAVSEARPAGA